MSCQHVSRLITTAATSVLSEDQDPYVFTETVPTTPPILFNAQKSRSKVYLDAHTIATTPTSIQSLSPTPTISAAAPTIATPTPVALAVASTVTNKRQTPIVTTNAKLKFNQKLPLGPLNGNNTKTQAASTLAAATGHNGPTAAVAAKAVSPSTVKTPNSQTQKQQQQHKKALNVCIVRPQQQQQQQQQLTQTVRQQQNYKAQQQRKQASSPPPLFQHTPSLWQTPLLLDTGSAVVSPPTSPASLSSPPVAVAPTPTSVTLPTAAATAMVSPLITVPATTLPPSKFHHNTLAQHLQKLECIKKPKKPIAVGNVHNGKSINQFQMQQNIQEQDTALKQNQTSLLLQQQPQKNFSEIGAKTVIVQPTAASFQAHVTQQSQSQTQMHKSPMAMMPSVPPPLQAIQAVSPPQHSDSDLNEIPVNVIFRKPQTSEMLQAQLGGSVSANAMNHTASTKSSSVVNATVNNRGSAIEINKTSPTKIKPKSISTAVTVAESTTLAASTLPLVPHVLSEIVFTHTGPAKIAPSEDTSGLPAHIYNTPHHQSPAAIHIQQQNMSSMAKPSPPTTTAQPLKYDTATPAQLARKPVDGIKDAWEEGKSSQKLTDTQNVIAVVKATSAAAKNAPKRKTSATATALPRNKNNLPHYTKKRSPKMGPLFRTYDNQMLSSRNDLLVNNLSSQKKRNCHAVAVVKMSNAEIEADTTLLSSDIVLPYCIQQHWLFITRDIQLVQGVGVVATAAGKNVGSLEAIWQATSDRESQITHRKMLLRRQAMQYLSTQSLQKLPMQAAKRRLLCVDRLLKKYERHGGDDFITPKNCNFVGCSKGVLEMAAQCEDHIVDNISQHIFLPCTAKFADNTQCRIPVFDVMHDLPLCAEHTRKRDAYNRVVHDQQRTGSHKMSTATVLTPMTQSSLDCDAGDLLRQLQEIQHQHKQQQQQYQQHTHMQHNPHDTATVGKNKKCVNVKATTTRKRKVPNIPASNTVGRPQKRPRKIGSNGAPSLAAAIAPLQLTSAVLQRKGSTTSLESIASNSQSSNSQPHYISSNINVQVQPKIAMPALAPLSGHNAPIVSSTLSASSGPKRMLNFSTGSVRESAATLAGTESIIAPNLKPHEINQLVAQFSVAVSSNNNNNNNENSNSHTAYSNSSMNNTYNYMSTNCDSNFTSALGSSPSLPSSTEELFRQELLSVCENSSAYASSEDTGLGGLSETELMVGPNDADDIPLGDTRLLEEHDLANVLSALPEDAFNELFTAVHQEEREEVERALELADKHLKSLQQTIGSDIDFLGEFPDDDEILADPDAMCSKMDMMHSPDATSGIDTSTLFIDSGSNSVGGGGGGSLNSSNIADIRGLVQT